MRFAEFKILSESKDTVVVIGDSIAVGIGGESQYAKGGISATEVLNRVNQFIQSGKAKGTTVILSSGASNSTYERPNGQKQALNMGPINQQLKLLKDAGATVVLVGTGSKKSKTFTNSLGTYFVNFEEQQVNQKLESAASTYGATFLGPLEEFDPNMNSGKGDGIHPYNGYKALYAAGAKIAPTPAKPQATKPEQGGKPATGSTAFSIEVPEVSLGWKGAGIMDVQKALVALGYNVGPTGTDGIRGKNTVAAIKQYQADRNLKVDGDPGPETVAALNKDIQSNPNKFASLVKSKPDDIKQSSRVGQQYSAQPVAYDAVTKGRVGEILNFVAAPESRGYYDMMFGGTRKAEILKMTIADANSFQNAWGKKAGSSAMGRYQIMHFNTIDYARKAGLDPKKDLFSPENQDKMGVIFLQEKGLDQWLAGKLDDKQFLEGLARVWAGLPAPSKGGNSYYGGVGLNRAETQVSMKTALNTLQDIKSA